MTEQLDELYFEWLYGKVSTHRRRRSQHNHYSLLWLIFKKEFVWLIPNDDNRVNDGTDLRALFFEETGGDWYETEWFNQGCSMLEMLIGLSFRFEFESGIPYRICFWEMISNLNLQQYNDSVDIPEDDVNDKIENVIWRTYSRNGSGGLFPLKRPKKDQREVELCYQMSAYIIERDERH